MGLTIRRPSAFDRARGVTRRRLELFESADAWLHMERPIEVEEYLEKGHMVVKAEIPGVDPDEDVKITMHDGLLDIRAERREQTSEEKDGYRTEFRYGMFRRTIPMPAGTKSDEITASYRDGILEVRLPVDTAVAEATKIPVTHD